VPPSLWDLPPLRYVDAQLRLRRLAGLDRETAPERLAAALAAQEAADAAADARLAAARPCAECGKPVLDGMNASGGLACSVPCFEAMSDRPGRYATRGGAR
jgi:hypothetical protein